MFVDGRLVIESHQADSAGRSRRQSNCLSRSIEERGHISPSSSPTHGTLLSGLCVNIPVVSEKKYSFLGSMRSRTPASCATTGTSSR